MKEIEGFILAGGASSRMGKDKAFLCVGGKILLQRSAAALRSVTENLYLVGSRLPEKLFLPVVPDVKSNSAAGKQASIIGLHSALAHAKTSWTIVLACDLPFVTGELLARLAAFCGKIHEKDNFDAIVPVQPDGKLQPLCALYKTETCQPLVEKMLAAENFRLQEIFGQLNARRVEFSEISDLPNAENFFFNVNTPEDLRRANEIAILLAECEEKEFAAA